MALRSAIEHAINANSAENGSDTPDFILAEYLTDCLAAFDKTVKARENWYGRSCGDGAAINGDGAAINGEVQRQTTEAPMRWNGYPPNTRIDGWHWLRHGELSPAYWSAETQEWSQGGLVCGGSAGPKHLASDTFVGGVEYVGECEIPNPHPDTSGTDPHAD